MATAPEVKNPEPTMREQDEVVTPADAKKMQEQLDEQRRDKAAEKAYNKSDKMSGEVPPKKMAKGGKVRSIDGIAQRGKTKLGRG